MKEPRIDSKYFEFIQMSTGILFLMWFITSYRVILFLWNHNDITEIEYVIDGQIFKSSKIKENELERLLYILVFDYVSIQGKLLYEHNHSFLSSDYLMLLLHFVGLYHDTNTAEILQHVHQSFFIPSLFIFVAVFIMYFCYFMNTLFIPTKSWSISTRKY